MTIAPGEQTVERTRLNGAIAALEAQRPVFATWSPVADGEAVAAARAGYDVVVFEMEHNPLDVGGLKSSMQFLLDRAQIVERGSLAPAVTPFVRIPPNGAEMSQWIAKQVLDAGVYGIIWPHVSTVEQARNAVAACRYPRPASAERYEPAGVRGDAPVAASRYWGLGMLDYYAVADVWPLDANGEIFVVIMIEDGEGVTNLPAILSEVEGIGAVLVGEGDLSQDLGYPRQYDHPEVMAARRVILDTCLEFGVVAGHPHVTAENVAPLIDAGYGFLISSGARVHPALTAGLAHVAERGAAQ